MIDYSLNHGLGLESRTQDAAGAAFSAGPDNDSHRLIAKDSRNRWLENLLVKDVYSLLRLYRMQAARRRGRGGGDARTPAGLARAHAGSRFRLINRRSTGGSTGRGLEQAGQLVDVADRLQPVQHVEDLAQPLARQGPAGAVLKLVPHLVADEFAAN